MSGLTGIRWQLLCLCACWCQKWLIPTYYCDTYFGLLCHRFIVTNNSSGHSVNGQRYNHLSYCLWSQYLLSSWLHPSVFSPLSTLFLDPRLAQSHFGSQCVSQTWIVLVHFIEIVTSFSSFPLSFYFCDILRRVRSLMVFVRAGTRSINFKTTVRGF